MNLKGSKLNTDETLLYHDRTKENKRKNRLRTSLFGSKESRAKLSIYHLVVLPDKPMYYVENPEDPDELTEMKDWWAENTVDFLNEIQLLYMGMVDKNEEWNELCALASKDFTLGYPPKVTYRWKVSPDTPPEVLPINKYIDHVFAWCNTQIENEDIFPIEEVDDFPADLEQHLSKMFKRLFRVFHIVFSNECFQIPIENDKSFELCFRHFAYFGWKWKLLSERESFTMKIKVPALHRKFERDEQLYLEKKLPLPKE